MHRDVVILTCAISGTIDQEAEYRRARDAGASVIQILPRHADGSPSFEVSDSVSMATEVRTATPEVVLSMGAPRSGGLLEQRIACLETVRPDIAAIRMGPADAPPTGPMDPFKSIVAMLGATDRLSIRPEHHCFDSGHVGRLDPLLDLDVLDSPLLIAMVLGVPGGIRGTPRNLAHLVDQIPGGPDGPHNWSLLATGREQWSLLAAALALGGNVRVGLVDNDLLPDGTVARSNAELVDVARRLIELTGRRTASSAEARATLRVPRLADDATASTSRSR